MLARAPAEAVRLLILRTHYRGLLDFTDAGLAEARREMDRFYRAVEHAPAGAAEVPAMVLDALCDDLNTAGAIAVMRSLADEAIAGNMQAAAALRASGHLLGLLSMSSDEWFRGDQRAIVQGALAATVRAELSASSSFSASVRDQGQASEQTSVTVSYSRERIDQLVQDRADARAARDFARGDAIRRELAEQGVVLEDKAEGTTWRRA